MMVNEDFFRVAIFRWKQFTSAHRLLKAYIMNNFFNFAKWLDIC